MVALDTKTPTPSVDRPPRRRWWLAAAAAVLAIVTVAAIVATRDDPESLEPSTPVVTVGETLPAPAAREERAIRTVRDFYAAQDAGDVDALTAMSHPDFVDIDSSRQMWEMNAAEAEAFGDFQEVGACEPVNVNPQYVEIACEVILASPVARALGVADVVAPARVFDDQRVVWLPWTADGDPGRTSAAIAEYLREFHADEFAAVCDPAAYEPGSVIVNRGLALTGPCGELFAPLADEIAEWVAAPTTREERAIRTVQDFYAAQNAGDVETLVAMSNPDVVDLDASRHMWEMNAVVADRYGGVQDVGECEPSNVNPQYVEVDCDVVLTDPVYRALGLADVVAPARVYDDQTVVWVPWRGGDSGAASAAYVDYLSEFRADEFAAVCDPAAYEPGSVIVNRGLALTGACGALMAPLADDIAEWIVATGR